MQVTEMKEQTVNTNAACIREKAGVWEEEELLLLYCLFYNNSFHPRVIKVPKLSRTGLPSFTSNIFLMSH